jgi:three-Cys-motif partner protein
MAGNSRYDEIGYWSEIKLDIIKEYAAAYSRILGNQRNPELYHLYIDAFAGGGKHISRSTGEFVLGSPLNALQVQPRFREYHFIDLDKQKVESLEQLAGTRQDVFIYHGDCNRVLLEKVLPRAKYKDYQRALCVLDPYGLHLDWEVLFTIGQMRSVEIFLNFPVEDMNRNVLWRKREGVSHAQIERRNKYWGDDSWKDVAYVPSVQTDLFDENKKDKASNEALAEAFRRRLEKVAGFKHVPKPIPMRNTRNAVVYYLFFASPKPVAERIVRHIFDNYATRMGS